MPVTTWTGRLAGVVGTGAGGPGGERLAAFARGVVGAGARVRLVEVLRNPPPGTLYHRADRHGISVVAVPTTGLSAEEVAALLSFRFAQYVDIGFVNVGYAYAAGMAAEPAAAVAPGDIHLIAGLPATGEILGYAVVEQPPPAPDGCRLRTADRAPFPVERVHGMGVFNRLPILPDLPVHRIREVGRFVRNHRPVASRDLVTRAVVEIGVSLFRLIAGPLRLHVDAVIGDLEERVAKLKFDFFHIPAVVVHGTVPYESSASYLHPRYQLRTVYPFACLASDIAPALPRLDAIERALDRPGKHGLVSLLRLRAQDCTAISILQAPDPAIPFAGLRLPQPGTTMHDRSQLLERGARLRAMAPFAGLSPAEAALLCTLVEQVEVSAGGVVARRGEVADALYLIERGEASLEVTDGAGAARWVGGLGPGQCCGYAAVLAGAEHSVDVIARTDMTLLRLSKQAYDTYLSQLTDVSDRLSRDALGQLAQVDQSRRRHRAEGGCGCEDGCGCTPGHEPEERP
jgi:hypothetical protein